MKKTILAILLILALTTSGCTQTKTTEKVTNEEGGIRVAGDIKVGTSTGQRAPNFALTDIHGNEFSLEDFQGSPTIVWFFAAWCNNCIAEAQALGQMNANYDEKGVKVVKIDLWPGETVADMRRFMEVSSTSPTDGIWALDTNETAIRYGVKFLDTTYILDRRGIITYKDERATDYATLAREIEKVL